MAISCPFLGFYLLFSEIIYLIWTTAQISEKNPENIKRKMVREVTINRKLSKIVVQKYQNNVFAWATSQQEAQPHTNSLEKMKQETLYLTLAVSLYFVLMSTIISLTF